MTEEAEKRFDKAMSKIFPSKIPSTSSPTSSAGTPSRELSYIGKTSLQGNKGSSFSRVSGLPPRLANSNIKTTTSSHKSSSPVCRPWDRGDLLRRLATFKSMTWFGKPKVVGPLNCAIKGWINVDVDIIACESCASRFNFSTPLSWTQHQVESAAEVFSLKLDEGHKAHCPWKGNACDESLAHFPPAPSHALVESYRDRCDALLELPALPVVSKDCIEEMKLSRPSQLDHLLSQPIHLPSMLRFRSRASTSEMTGDDSASSMGDLYYQALKLISLCGWELRLLPYLVDCEDYSTQAVKEGNVGDSSPTLAHIHSPSVMLRSKTSMNEGIESSQNKSAGIQRKSEPASAVLDCGLCGASVGMWTFNTVSRPLHLIGNDSINYQAKPSDSALHGISAASCIGGMSSEGKDKECLEDFAEATASSYKKSKSEGKICDLSLTIAGGLPPTKQNVFLEPLHSFTEQVKGGVHSSSEVGEQAISSDSRELPKKSQGTWQGGVSSKYRKESAESMDVEKDGNNSAWSAKRKWKDASSELSRGLSQAGQGKTSERFSDTEYNSKSKRRRDAHPLGDKHAIERASSEFHGVSSVNAVDTCFHDRRENSTESVDNVPLISSKSYEEVEEGTATNIATISTGRAVGTSMGNSGFLEPSVTQIDGQGDTGVDFSVNKEESRAAESEVLGESGRCGRGEVSSIGDRTVCVSVCEDSQNAVVVNNNVARSGFGDVSSAGDKAPCVSVCEDSQHAVLVNQSTVDTTMSKDSGQEIKNSGEKSEVCQPIVCNTNQGRSEITTNTPKTKFVEPAPGMQSDTVKLDAQLDISSGVFAAKDSEPRIWGRATEFDPIKQHRHFCPWVTPIGASSGDKISSHCGWQLTIDAVDQCSTQELASASLKESESTSSRFKVNPVTSVRKLFETPSSKKSRRQYN